METTTEFKFIIPATQRAVNSGELQDVIEVVHWILTATDPSGVTAETYGALPLGMPSAESFTPYKQITDDIVIGWVEQFLDAEETSISTENTKKSILTIMKENLQEEIALKISPKTITEPLPSTLNTEN